MVPGSGGLPLLGYMHTPFISSTPLPATECLQEPGLSLLNQSTWTTTEAPPAAPGGLMSFSSPTWRAGRMCGVSKPSLPPGAFP